MKVISAKFTISAGQTGNPKSFTTGPWPFWENQCFFPRDHGPIVKLLGFAVWPAKMENFAEMTFMIA